MFDLLKKKIGGFIDNIVKKGESKPEPIKEKPIPEIKIPSVSEPEIKVERKIEVVEVKQEPKPEEKKEVKIEKKIEPKIEKKIEPKSVVEKKSEPVLPKPESIIVEKPTPAIFIPKETTKPKIKPKEIVKPKEEPGVRLGLFKQVTSIFTGEVEISEKEVEELLENLEIELLESDVAIEVADEIKSDLKNAIVGKKIKRGELDRFVKETIKHTLKRLVSSEKGFDLIERMQSSERPMKIVFLGVNGAGKTTTIAKVAKLLMNHGLTVVVASADTFRAAAIEQMQIHADRLGIRNIKRDYGSDPSAVAYDAVNYAKAHNIDAVLIDTAGRQETNLNLINELKKMERVIQPHLKVYVGESIAGNAILSQVEEFNQAVGIDGVILTKLDCDAKGGTVLSITKSTGIPIVYIGTGQKYEDLEKFDAEKIVERILE